MNLRSYQKEAIEKMAQLGSAGLFFDTGIGKTATALGLVNHLSIESRVLYICPASLKFEVEKEVKKWMPEASVQVIHGPAILRKMQWKQKARFTIANYEVLLRDKDIMPKSWNMIIADEGHRISNVKAQITKHVHKLLSPRRIVMTGTPVMSRPEQIWSLIHWIKPNHLGHFYRDFLPLYCIMNRFRGIAGYRNLEHLNERIKDLYIRKNKRDVEKDLPLLTISQIPVELSDNERRLYDIVKKELLFELRQNDLSIPLGSLGSAGVNIIRLRQIIASLELVSDIHKESSKIDALKDKLDELFNIPDEKIIIYTQFAKFADIIMREIARYNPLLIKGDVDSKDRSDIVEKFWKDPAHRVMVITGAGGQGLNLQIASTLITMDLSFSMGQNHQIIGRIERIGQMKPMMVYNITARKTIDEYINKVLVKRKEDTAKIFGDDSEEKIKVGDMVGILEEEGD